MPDTKSNTEKSLFDDCLDTAKKIAAEASRIAIFAGGAWVFKAGSTAAALGKSTSWSVLMRENGGYFPSLRNTSGKPHQMTVVANQMGWNVVTHRLAEEYTDNKVVVASAAAAGASVSTFRMTCNELGLKGSLPRLLRQSVRTPQQALFLLSGFLSECFREWFYNEGCLNLKPKLESLNLSGWQLLLGTGLASTSVGILSGLPNASASLFYKAAIVLRAKILPNSVPELQSLLRCLSLASLLRGVGIGVVFTVMEAERFVRGLFHNPPPQDNASLSHDDQNSHSCCDV